MIYRFFNPIFFLLLLVVVFIAWWHRQGKRQARLIFSDIKLFKVVPPSPLVSLHPFLFWMRLLALSLAICALARPQSGMRTTEVLSSGIDIMLTVDTSGSMQALDFELDGKRKNRLEVIKGVVEEFVQRRKADRIGMVVFGTEAFTQCPLTSDHDALLMFLKDVSIGAAGENTAIGSAIGTATKRLKDLQAKSKVIILLTDGTNNAGNLSPDIAAEAAAALGIRIYTIAVGTRDEAPVPVRDPFSGIERLVNQRFPIDEESLKKIANTAGGRFFRATDSNELREIYDVIDRLEKSETKIKEYDNFNEQYLWFLLPALVLLLMERLLLMTRFRTFP